MKGDDVPASDQIVRYIKPILIRDDGTADGAGFCLRANRPDDTGLSVNWLEVFGQDKTFQLAEVRRLSRITVSPNGRFAEMNVGAVKRKVADEMSLIRIVQSPLLADDRFDADPSHSEIVGLPAGDSDESLLIGDLIAECIESMHSTTIRKG